MWTPDGYKPAFPRSPRNKSGPPKFKVGDRVAIAHEPQRTGTVEAVPKTARGSYTVRYDGGYFPFHDGRDIPQSHHEESLRPADIATAAGQPSTNKP